MAHPRTLRRRLGLSQAALAELLGVHAMTVSRWERGLLAPNAHQRRVLKALADAGEAGLRAQPKAPGRGSDPLRFLAAALGRAYSAPELDLGALSATNRFRGQVIELRRGDVMSKVVIEIAPGVRIGSVITTDSVDRLGLEIGSSALAIIKATEVIIGVT